MSIEPFHCSDISMNNRSVLTSAGTQTLRLSPSALRVGRETLDAENANRSGGRVMEFEKSTDKAEEEPERGLITTPE